MIDVEIVTEGSEHGVIEHLTTLRGVCVTVSTAHSETRPYLAGSILMGDGSQLKPIADVFHRRTTWAVVNETHVRIQGFENYPVVGYARLFLDQSTTAELTLPGGGWEVVRIVEPSPPVATEEWWTAELERVRNDRAATRRRG